MEWELGPSTTNLASEANLLGAEQQLLLQLHDCGDHLEGRGKLPG